MKKFLSFLDSLSLVGLILAMCSQLDVRHIGRDTWKEGLGYMSKTLAVALSDVMFLAVAVYFVIRVIQLKAWKKLWWPPLACYALLFAMVLGTVHSGRVVNSIPANIESRKNSAKEIAEAKKDQTPAGKEQVKKLEKNKPSLIPKEAKEALAEVVQWSAYFLVAPWIFVNLLHDRRDGYLSRRVLGIAALVFAVMVNGIVALAQIQNVSEFAPVGLFGSPNIYGAFLALTIPFLIENESDDIRVQGRYWIIAAVMIFITFATVVSPWAFIALGIGMVVAVLARTGPVKVKAYRLAIVAALALVTVGLWRVPQSLAPFRGEQLRLSSAQQDVKKQFVEWQAAIGWSTPRERAFATGVGPGNYQLNIGPFYNSLPNEEKMPPDSNNLYLVQAVSIGMLGLSALLWVVFHFWGTAWRAAKKFPGDWLGAGVCAALSSWLFVNLFHALVVRGVGLVLAFLFALAVIALEGERNEETPKAV
ncbi:hypothetical protein EON80_11880 [bacterium]|nr:MAG: hypothetical protein EON80_11880 [bacterium]